MRCAVPCRGGIIASHRSAIPFAFNRIASSAAPAPPPTQTTHVSGHAPSIPSIGTAIGRGAGAIKLRLWGVFLRGGGRIACVSSSLRCRGNEAEQRGRGVAFVSNAGSDTQRGKGSILNEKGTHTPPRNPTTQKDRGQKQPGSQPASHGSETAGTTAGASTSRSGNWSGSSSTHLFNGKGKKGKSDGGGGGAAAAHRGGIGDAGAGGDSVPPSGQRIPSAPSLAPLLLPGAPAAAAAPYHDDGPQRRRRRPALLGAAPCLGATDPPVCVLYLPLGFGVRLTRWFCIDS